MHHHAMFPLWISLYRCHVDNFLNGIMMICEWVEWDLQAFPPNLQTQISIGLW